MPLRLMSIAIIPARINATRFPKKILHPIQGKPMIEWVYGNVAQAKGLDKVLVATDSPEIAAVVKGFGGSAVLTPDHFQSGTDRVAWAAQNLNFEIVVNVQGDEPLLGASAVEQLIEALEKHADWDMATLAAPLSDADRENENAVKVVVKASGEALTFGRAMPRAAAGESVFKHVGIYAYRRAVLEKFSRLPQSESEKKERLEQLRALDHGWKIGVVQLSEDTVAVDVPDDVKKVEARMMRHRFHIPVS